jgi:hypothetical protein
MSKSGPGFVVLYRWKLHPDKETMFVEAWSRLTEQLLLAGSLGSRLHRSADGTWYAYAQWPNEDTRQRAFAQELDPEARARLRSAVAESFPELVLESIVDYLIPTKV